MTILDVGRKAVRIRIASILAWMWICVPILGAIHDGSENHRYCAEHDTFEDLPRPSAPSTQSTARRAAPNISDLGLERADDGVRAGHQACLFAKARARTAASSSVRTAGIALTDSPTPFRAGHDRRPIPILAFAPKASPPSLA